MPSCRACVVGRLWLSSEWLWRRSPGFGRSHAGSRTCSGFQRKMDVSLGIIEQRLRANEDRLRRLEAEQQQVVMAAGAAATAAAASIASAVLSDVVPRVKRIEGRTEQLERRLPLAE
jgi:hypothetical protein